MQALIKKNKKFRKFYSKSELNYYINSALTKNKILSKQNLINLLNSNQKRLLKEQQTSPKISMIRGLCILTGRSRGLIQDYKLSRLKFKELAEAGFISGVKKK